MKRVIVQALAIAMVVSSLPVSAAGPAGTVGRPATGTIQGLAASSSGQTLSNVTVQVRNLQSGAIAGSTTSNAIGRFSFAGVNPGRYIVEVARQSAIVGSSSAVDVAAGSTVNVTVNTLAAANVAYGAAQTTSTASHGVRTAVIITTIAAGAGIAAAIAIANNDDKASPSR